MAKIKESHIECGNCGHRFRSPIFFANTEAFNTAIASGNRAQCPKCRAMINCNLENMKYVLEDGTGGFVGQDFEDNKGR